MTVFTNWPVRNVRISQDFWQENTWDISGRHQGIDLTGTLDTDIIAPCDMFIVWAGFGAFNFGNTWEMIPGSTNSGGCIIGQPPAPHTALQTSFSHMSQIFVKPGQWVTAGTVLGKMGSTGFSTGVHLHWEAFIDYAEGVYPLGSFYGRVDPKDYFKTVTVVPTTPTGGKGSAPVIPVNQYTEDEKFFLDLNIPLP